MRLLKQLEFAFRTEHAFTRRLRRPPLPEGEGWGEGASTVALQFRGRDHALELKARDLLRLLGATKLAHEIRVEWNPRMKSAAGRADFREKLISLNPRLCDHGLAEIDRTFRHELAHLLAQFRAGRRRILPHGAEWRQVCRDLGIGDEMRCHNLPLAISKRVRRF